MHFPLNGNLKNIIGIGGILLTLGAGYGIVQTTIHNLTDRVSALETIVETSRDNPMASGAGQTIEAEIHAVDQRLDRIEAKQDQIIFILTGNHAH